MVITECQLYYYVLTINIFSPISLQYPCFSKHIRYLCSYSTKQNEAKQNEI